MERYWDGRLWTDENRPLAMPPPLSGRVVGRTESGGWDWKWLLFSFKGRAHRAHYWAVFGVSVLFAVVAFIPVALLSESSIDDSDFGSGTPGVLVFALLAFYFLFLWAQLAVGVKRWHDRDKSGAWMFIVLIPFGSLWVLIECGFLPGTDGPNQYGGDPRRVSSSPY